MPAGSKVGSLFVELLLEDSQFTDKLGDAEGKLKGAGQALDRFATTITTTVVRAFQAGAAAAAAFAAAATVVGSSFEQQMAKVAAISGITADRTSESFAALEDKARALGRTTLFTATEAAEGLEAMARAGLQVEESIAAADAALLLAGSSSAGIAESTSLIVATMKQFNLTAEESTRISDVFSKAMRTSLLDFESLREAMKFAGTAGAAFGMTLEETVAAVAQFRDLGLEGSLAGTNLRMALTLAAKGGDTAEAALKKYGLTLADVNPEVNSFADIMEQLARVNISATDSIQVFGSRAGANIAQISNAVREGSTDIRAFTADLVASVGETGDIYATMTDTVQAKGKIVISALQDVLIQAFETFAGPLTDILEGIPKLLAMIGSEVRRRSGEIEAVIGGTFGSLEDWLDANGRRLATAFGDALVWILRVGDAVAKLIPLMDKLAIVVASAFVAAKVAQFTRAIEGAIPIVQALTAKIAALRAGTLTLTGSIAGPVGLAAGLAALIGGFTAYAYRAELAKQAAEKLADAQDKLADESVAASFRMIDAIAPVLQAQQEEARGMMEEMAARGELTHQLQTEIESLLELDAASAALKVTKGELVLATDEYGTRLRTVAGLVEDMQLEQVNDAIATQGRRVSDLSSKYQDVEDAIKNYTDAAQGSEKVALHALEVIGAGSIEAAQEMSQAYSDQLKDAQKALDRLRNESTRAKAAMFQREAQAADAAMGKLTQFANLSEAELNKLTKTMQEQEKELAILLAMWDQMGKPGNVGAIEDMADQLFETLELLRGAEIQRLGDLGLGDADDLIDPETIARLRDLSAEVGRLVPQEPLTRVQKLENLLALLNEEAARSPEAAEAIGEMAAQVNEEIEDLPEDEEGGLPEWAENSIIAIGKVRDTVQRLGQALKDAASKGLDLFETLTGISLDIGSFIGMAGEAGTKEEAGAAAQEMVDNALAFVQAVAENLPVIIDKLVAALPELFDAVIEAIPVIFQSLVSALPTILDGLLEMLPVLLQAILDAIPTMIQELARTLPTLIMTLVEYIPQIIAAIIRELPNLIGSIVDALPDIIDELAAQIPNLLDAIFEAIPQIILRIIQALPEIVSSIIGLLDEIAIGLVEAIVTELIPMIPTLVVELVKALAMMISEVAQAFWDALKGAWESIKQFFRDVWREIVTLGAEETKSFGDTPHPILAGPQGLLARFAPGDIVVAAQNMEGLLSQLGSIPSAAASQVAGAIAGAPAFAGAGAGGETVLVAQVDVNAEGRLLESILLTAGRRGRAPAIQKAVKASKGVRTGIDSGRFKRWGS